MFKIKLFLYFSVLINKKKELGFINNESLLIEKFRKGDRKAFGILFKKYVNSVFRYVLYCTSSKQMAEEITQDVFVKVAEAIRNGVNIKYFKGYIMITARNKCYDYFNKNRKYDYSKDMLLNNLTSLDNPFKSFFNNSTGEAIFKAVSKLSPEQKEAFVMKEINGLKIKEIAEITNTNENTVKSRLRYALIKLKQELKEFYHG